VLVALLVIWIGWRILAPAKPQEGDGAASGGHGHGRGAGGSVAPVGVAKLGLGSMHVVLTGLGTVTPTATITVQTQISGQLTAVGFKEGQVVKKGQFLAQIDPRPYEIALAQAQGALAHDSGLLAQAKSDLARYETLAAQDSIAKQQVADQEYLVQQDEGTVAEDKATIRSDQLNLTYCHIVSPVNGRVGLRLVDPGNYVQTSSSTGLVVITELQPITVVFVLPEDDIAPIQARMRSGEPLEVAAYDRTNDNQIAKGKLIAVDNTVDTTTGTVKIRASFANADQSLFPNEFVNARLLLKTLDNVLRVPVQAIQYGAPGTFVYLLKPDNSVHVQVIKTGVTDGDYVQVLSGLQAGDQVVTDGAALLREGSKVRVMAASQGHGHVTVNNGPGAPPGQQPQNAWSPASGDKQSSSPASGADPSSAPSGRRRHSSRSTNP
jgi:multidrug efflux system membrane fusion protein